MPRGIIGEIFSPKNNLYCINISTNEEAKISPFEEMDSNEEGAICIVVREPYRANVFDKKKNKYCGKICVNIKSLKTNNIYRVFYKGYLGYNPFAEEHVIERYIPNKKFQKIKEVFEEFEKLSIGNYHSCDPNKKDIYQLIFDYCKEFKQIINKNNEEFEND